MSKSSNNVGFGKKDYSVWTGPGGLIGALPIGGVSGPHPSPPIEGTISAPWTNSATWPYLSSIVLVKKSASYAAKEVWGREMMPAKNWWWTKRQSFSIKSWILSNLDSTLIVTKHRSSIRLKNTKLVKKSSKPNNFSSSRSHNWIQTLQKILSRLIISYFSKKVKKHPRKCKTCSRLPTCRITSPINMKDKS